MNHTIARHTIKPGRPSENHYLENTMIWRTS
jgi:hypothetical protein